MDLWCERYAGFVKAVWIKWGTNQREATLSLGVAVKGSRKLFYTITVTLHALQDVNNEGLWKKQDSDIRQKGPKEAKQLQVCLMALRKRGISSQASYTNVSSNAI